MKSKLYRIYYRVGFGHLHKIWINKTELWIFQISRHNRFSSFFLFTWQSSKFDTGYLPPKAAWSTRLECITKKTRNNWCKSIVRLGIVLHMDRIVHTNHLTAPSHMMERHMFTGQRFMPDWGGRHRRGCCLSRGRDWVARSRGETKYLQVCGDRVTRARKEVSQGHLSISLSVETDTLYWTTVVWRGPRRPQVL